MTYEEFVAARLQPLLRFAVMLTGDPHLAQDLVQDTMVRVRLQWLRGYVQVDTGARSPVDLIWHLRGATSTVVAAQLPVIPTATSVVLDPTAPELLQALRTDTLAAWLTRHPAAAVSMESRLYR